MITLAIMYTLREGYQEILLSLQAWRLLWKLFLSLLGGRNSFSSLGQWMDSHPCLMPPVFCFVLFFLSTANFFFHVLCILYFEINQSVPLRKQKGSPKFPFRMLCVQ